MRARPVGQLTSIHKSVQIDKILFAIKEETCTNMWVISVCGLAFFFSKIVPIESAYLKYLGKRCKRFMLDLLSTNCPQRNSHFHDVGHRILIEHIPFGRCLSII